ncbi:MAG: hypothetical protein GY742_14770 [Hyphomicrobiales bacterium]|nr:hypothetical protein [Hyphomicrobiales bacterium]
MSDFTLSMHQASEGDCLVLSWGAEPKHAVIDLGRTKDYKAIRGLLEQIQDFELFVITHIDADHISGAMPMVREKKPAFSPKDVWFNGFEHLRAAKKRSGSLEALSVRQGDKLERGISKFDWRWNHVFGGDPVSINSSAASVPIELSGNLMLTLLSPSDSELTDLEPEWSRWLKKHSMREIDADSETKAPPGLERLSVLDVDALAAEKFKEDTEEPNGSSIAFLAEYEGRCILLGADAFPSRVVSTLKKLGYSRTNKIKLDLLKLCHHGSKGNTSPELLSLIDCVHFAVSTDGARHNHPNPQTIARILVNDPDRPKRFYFNTRQPNTEIWDVNELKSKWNYECILPGISAPPGITVKI